MAAVRWAPRNATAMAGRVLSEACSATAGFVGFGPHGPAFVCDSSKVTGAPRAGTAAPDAGDSGEAAAACIGDRTGQDTTAACPAPAAAPALPPGAHCWVGQGRIWPQQPALVSLGFSR